eukprot:scaffold121585_cov17-Prasinocladus_malaysianus.AAC.1
MELHQCWHGLRFKARFTLACYNLGADSSTRISRKQSPGQDVLSMDSNLFTYQGSRAPTHARLLAGGHHCWCAYVTPARAEPQLLGYRVLVVLVLKPLRI